MFNNTDKRRNALSDYANTIDVNSSRFNKDAGKIAEEIIGRKPRNNKESKNIIKEFINNVDTGLLMGIFTMFGTVITTSISLYRSFKKFNDGSAFNGNNSNRGSGNRYNTMFESETILLENDNLDKFERIKYSNINILVESEYFTNLNESEKIEMVQDIKDKSISEVIDNELNQFKFENGGSMESLISNELSNINFSLRYHVNKTNNVEDFIDSVENYLKVAEIEMTDFDREALVSHYMKYK